MARLFPNGIDLNNTQLLNTILQTLASDPAFQQGKVFYHSGSGTLRFGSASQYLVLGRLDQISAPAAAVSFNSQKLTNLQDGTNPQDATSLSQVQSLVSAIAGQMAWKDSVRVAAPGNISVSSPGSTIDGITMVSGDRVLLPNQTAGSENGIYVWNGASSAMTRATDANTAAAINSATVPVEQGTANADTVWIMTTDSVTLGTTALSFAVLFRNTSQLRKYVQTYGGSASQAISHGLATSDVQVQVRETASNNIVEPDIVITDANTVTLVEATAPAASSRRVVVLG